MEVVIMAGIKWFFTEDKAFSHIIPFDLHKIPCASRVDFMILILQLSL